MILRWHLISFVFSLQRTGNLRVPWTNIIQLTDYLQPRDDSEESKKMWWDSNTFSEIRHKLIFCLCSDLNFRGAGQKKHMQWIQKCTSPICFPFFVSILLSWKWAFKLHRYFIIILRCKYNFSKNVLNKDMKQKTKAYEETFFQLSEQSTKAQ